MCRWRGCTRIVIALTLGLLALATASAAQTRFSSDEPDYPEKSGKELHALRVVGAPPRIDGLLDDDVWSVAPAIDDLVQSEPDNMAPPRSGTRVQVAYTNRMLYVAIRASTGEQAPLTTGLGRRDVQPAGDLVRVVFDPRHDHQNAYVFELNPSGMQSDYLYYGDTQTSPDYDAVWDARTRISLDGWTAELAIPFSQLRFSVVAGHTSVWGFNVGRDIFRTGENDWWVGTPRGGAGVVSRFGHLVFDELTTTPRRVELLPFALGRRSTGSQTASDQSVAGGIDMRIGLGTAATLAATVNPDFGQVEQDPAVLNLSVYETFFQEKRPFFVEDSRLFVPNFPQMLLFHSRRIGRPPGYFDLPDGDTEMSRPAATTILGAAKITGRAGAWSYGGLAAATGAEYATVTHSVEASPAQATLTRDTRLVEPRTTYSVGRVLRDFRGGSSSVGVLATSTMRDGAPGATTGGGDFTLRWDGNRGVWTGIGAASHASIDGVRRAGGSVLSNVSYARKFWSIDGHIDHISESFRNSDLGFLGSRPNKSNVNYGVNLIRPDPSAIFRNYRVFTYADRTWNGVGLRETDFGVGFDFVLKNYWAGTVRVNRDFENLNDLDSRGGPPIVKPSAWLLDVYARTDSRRTLVATWSSDLRRDAVGGWTFNGNPTVRVRPSGWMQASLGVAYESGVDLAQWIDNVDVTGDGVDDNVYGRLHRSVISITGRTTVAFTRDMTIEAYLQPFVAVGDYSDIKRLVLPRSFAFAPATLPTDPDFNNKSLRSNVVFRWEYQKGSSLFLVWNTSRADEARPGVFQPARDLRDAFGGAGTHVFMVKLSYWLGL